jgi:hypothetical protein
MRTTIASLLLALALALLASLAVAIVPADTVIAATSIYVNATAGDDSWDGQAPAWDGTHGPKKTIQAGVNVVDIGGTVNVAAGVYDEQVVVTKSLTLRGVGDATIVRPSAPGVLTSLYVIPAGYWKTQNNTLASVISVQYAGGSGVTVSDIKVDGTNVAPRPDKKQFTVGVSYGVTGGLIDNVTVVNLETVSEGPRSYGFWLDGWNTATSVEVRDCYVEHFNRNGIMVNGATLTAYVHDNTIKGLTRVSQVPNGIIIMDGATANISRNTITDCHYTPAGPPQWYACGIGMYQYCAPGVVIEHNTVSQCDVGIAPSNDAIVRHNLLTNNYIGLTLDQGASNDTIICNDILNNIDGIVMGLDPGSVVHWNNIVGNGFGVRNLYTIMLDARNNWWGDDSGPNHSSNPTGMGNPVSDYVDFDPWIQKSTPTATGTGNATFTTNQGNVLGLTAVTPPAGVTFPHGMFNFTICCIPSGGTVTLIVTLPEAVPVCTRWYKYIGGSWYSLPIGGGGTSVITVTLTDGAFPDDEDTILGQITDQGGPACLGAGGGAVGWETYPVNKMRVFLPWIALIAAIMAGVSLLVLSRRRAQS